MTASQRQPDFTDYIAERTLHFTGREWVFEQIDAWLEKEDKPVFFLTGGPGSGKTAVAARLVQISSGTVPAPNTSHLVNQPLAYYFFCQAGSEELDPLRFVTNLALVLADRFEEYAEALVSLGNKQKDEQNIIVHQRAGRIAEGGQMTGVAIESLTITDLSARLAFNRTIREPLLDLYQKGLDSTIIILIDALDEALTYHKEENLVTLLKHLLDMPQELPPNMHFILTGRRDEDLLHQLPPPTLDLIDGAPDDLDDVRRYTQRRLRKLAAEQRQVLAERIAVTGKGNFLYARYVLDDLLPRLTPETDVSTLLLPNKLKDIYQNFLDRELTRTTGAWQEKYGSLVSILAVSRGEGLTRDQLAGMVDLAENEADRILTPIQQYLSYQTPNGPFRIYHQSFREFLLSLDEGAIRVYPAQAHRTIAGFFLDDWKDGDSDEWDEYDKEYAFQHLPYHIKWAGAGLKKRRKRQEWAKRLRALLLDFGWLQAKLEQTDINSLLNDFDFLDTDDRQDPLRLVEGAIRLSAHILAEDKEQLSSQLYGRLLPLEHSEIANLREQINAQTQLPWLKLQTPTMISPGGALIRTLTGHTARVSSVALSADGRTLVSGSWDGTIRLWDVETGRELRRFEGHTWGVTSVALSADGRTFISGSGSADKTIRLWEVETGRELRCFEGHTAAVTSVALSADGRMLVSGSADNTIRLWEMETGRELRRFEGHTWGVTSVALSADERTLVSGSGSVDKNIRLWEVETGRELRRFEGHTWGVTSVALSADGRTLVSGSGSADKTIRLWEVATGRELRRFEGHTLGVNSVALSGDGRFLVSGSWDKTVRLWEVETSRELRRLDGHTREVNTVALSAGGGLLVSGSGDKTIRLWEVETGRELRRFEGHTGWVRSVALSRDGRFLVSGSEDKTIRLWDVRTGREQQRFRGHTGWIYSVALSGDGRTLVSGSDDKTIRLWEVETGRELRRFEGHTDWVYSVALSADDCNLFSGSRDGTIRLWEVETGQELRRFEGHTEWVKSVALSADGRTLVSGSGDKTIRLWEVETGQELRRFEGHAGWVESVALSVDGRLLVSTSVDRTVRLWGLVTSQQIAAWTSNGNVNACDISGDGQTIAIGDDGGQVHIFTLANYE